mmetsp:Transcript_19913/g.32802  ORF Transcript_19913/g.32802 Transcript_19913/m.32802 type:complete len:283 (+) Transcript_19913:3-851(+)
MAGDFDENRIESATSEWLQADLDAADDDDEEGAGKVAAAGAEKLPIFMRSNFARKVASLSSTKQVEERVEEAAASAPGKRVPEFVIVGRTNTGKSTMINHLLNIKKLVQASRKPGKTTCVDIFDVNGRFTLADTPGYSVVKNKVSEKWDSHWLPLVDAFMEKTPWIQAGLFLMDIGKDVDPVDKQIVQLFTKHRIPLLLVLTKDDKIVDRQHRMDRIKRIREDLGWPSEFPHVRYTSFKSNRSSKNQRVSRIQMRKALAKLIALESRDQARLFLSGMESEAA